VDVIVFVIEALRFTDADRAVLEQMPKQVPVVFVVNKLDKAKDRDVLAEFIANAKKNTILPPPKW
jgi:GTP-binding protein Era